MPRRAKAKIPKIEYLGNEDPTDPRLRMLLHEHYFRIMPNHRHHRVIMWSVFLLIIAVLMVQFAYPLDRGLPFAKLGTQSTFFEHHEQLAKRVADTFDRSEFKLVVGDKTYQRPLKLAGAEPETEKVIDHMTEYPFWERFIPFSILFQQPVADRLPVVFAASRLEESTSEAFEELNYPPADAVLSIENGDLKVATAKSGREVSIADVRAALSGVSVIPGQVTTVDVPSREVPAKRSLDDVAAVRAQAEAALALTLDVRIEGQSIELPVSTIASWLALTEDKDGVISLGLAEVSINAFVDQQNEKYAVAAEKTNVTVVNGRETQRTTGADGRTIDKPAFIAALQRQLIDAKGSEPIDITFVAVSPVVVYNNTYSATRDGLQSYINDVSKSRNMHIMIQQLDGEKWAVEARAHESLPSASTYKLFVTLALFDRMDRGEIDWGTPILDTNVSGCFERMVVASTNPCAEQFITLFGGYAAINNFIYVRGFSHETDFTNSIAKHTSAAALTQYMIGLEQGTLLQGAQRDKLLDALGRHPYRDGIPRGSKGKVNDKVGFLWDYVHDTAIVHHPRGTYVMTIMSKGQSYARIAEVTREIERIMYP